MSHALSYLQCVSQWPGLMMDSEAESICSAAFKVIQTAQTLALLHYKRN